VLPLRIEPCPIIEAVAEVRFSTAYPSEAVFGVVYSKLNETFPEVEKLPILQMPEVVRNQDPNLRYQPQYALKKGNLQLRIGPRTLTFSNSAPYLGWRSFYAAIVAALEHIRDTEVIKFPERIGIRYINLFKGAILDRINVRVVVSGTELATESTNLRTEVVEGDFIKIIQVANNVGVNTPAFSGPGSLLDVDCIYNFAQPGTDFYSRYEEVFKTAHAHEKETFFSLLKAEFLDQLNPVYGEE